MHTVYILFSKSANKFYVGQTDNLNLRLELHNTSFFKGAYTVQAKDWELFLEIPCEARAEAIFIEKHIKSMKSKTYYQNIQKYLQIIQSLKEKFRGSQSR
jgi:putative endonuclease